MQVNIILNGTKVTAEAAPDTLLIDFVRAHGCYSVKRGCETSNCGLCTVFLDDVLLPKILITPFDIFGNTGGTYSFPVFSR